MATAWLLQRSGHRVLLVDPCLGPGESGPGGSGPGAADPGADSDGSLSGSRAALGVLMGRVFQRSSGRAWRLRQRSLELWHAWRQELAGRGRPIAIRQGLLLLAADGAERERQERLLQDRRRQGHGLELWEPERLAGLDPQLPQGAVGALHSPQDGQLDPLQALEALHSDAIAAGLTGLGQAVAAVERGPGDRGWRMASGSPANGWCSAAAPPCRSCWPASIRPWPPPGPWSRCWGRPSTWSYRMRWRAASPRGRRNTAGLAWWCGRG